MSTDRCATIIDEATGAVCGHRLGEHHMVAVPTDLYYMAMGHKITVNRYPCTFPNDPSGTLPPSCPCSNFTPEGT